MEQVACKVRHSEQAGPALQLLLVLLLLVSCLLGGRVSCLRHRFSPSQAAMHCGRRQLSGIARPGTNLAAWSCCTQTNGAGQRVQGSTEPGACDRAFQRNGAAVAEDFLLVRVGWRSCAAAQLLVEVNYDYGVRIGR